MFEAKVMFCLVVSGQVNILPQAVSTTPTMMASSSQIYLLSTSLLHHKTPREVLISKVKGLNQRRLMKFYFRDF